MKTLSQIITFSSIISLAVAAGAGYVVTYTGADCLQASGATTGFDTNIPQDTCDNIALFTSFQAGVAIPCPNGGTPKLTLFTEQNCGGTAVDAGTLPANGIVGPCQEIVVETGSSSVSVGGHSASFKCL